MSKKKLGMLELLNDLQDLYMTDLDSLMYNYHAGTLYSMLDYAEDYHEKFLCNLMELFIKLDSYIIEDYDFIEVIKNKYYNIDNLEYCIKINKDTVELVYDKKEDEKYRRQLSRSSNAYIIYFMVLMSIILAGILFILFNYVFKI